MSALNMIEIPVRDITPNIRPWFITGRVIRMWNTPFCSRLSRVLSVEFVVIDAHGDKIQASVSRDILRLKRIDMDEGDFLRVSSVIVVPNDGKDRATRHAFRLVVDMCSMLEKSEPMPARNFGLTPMNTSDIVRNKNETQFIVDKVGLLTSLSCEREYVKDDKHLTVSFLEIRDPTGSLECMLYDDYVEDVRQFLKNNGPTTPVVVIQFARIAHEGKVLFGDVSIENVVNITRVHFEPALPDQFEMISWLIMSGISLEGRLKFVNMDIPSPSLRDEFLLYHPRKRIEQLMRRGKGGKYVVWGRIIGFNEDEMWWFSSCKHYSCMSEGSSLFDCDGDYAIVPRYNLKVEVSDRETVAIFNLGMRMFRTLSKCHVKSSSNLWSCFNVRRVCAEAEIVRMFLRGEFFHADQKIKSTISRILGVQGDAEHFNICKGSSHASAMPDDNFGTDMSAFGQCSFCGSTSVNFEHKHTNMNINYGPPVDKYRVQDSRGNN
ncbi:Nucleic acid-binding, OB-fold [Sesbania bispinosa]|nr:Nucleic acid-binding, OB-fold [Sesbania bispinosa]